LALEDFGSMNFDVFISYASQDKAIADAACAKLEADGIRCWIAPRDVPPGAEWAGAIIDAIDHCRAMVLIFSSKANGSKQIRREVQRAFEREVPVVPFRIENIVPEKSLAYYIGSVHWLDALTLPLEQHLQRLAVSVKAFAQIKAVTDNSSEELNTRETVPKWRAEREQEFATVKHSDSIGAYGERPTTREAWQLSRRALLAAAVLGVALVGSVGVWLTGVQRTSVQVEPVSARQSPASVSPKAATPPPVIGNPDATTATKLASLADITAAADRGDPAAQNELGVRYSQGEDGLAHDDTKAVEWYRKSAVQKYAKAETNLGDMYFFGRGGLDKDYAKAFSWYLKAAQQDRPAQYRLGYMYEMGLGTDKDVPHAVELYRSAANGGFQDAENMLGNLLATASDGLPQDDNEAVVWYRKAADQGFDKAQKNLGDMYFFGRGVDRDYQQAMLWYKKAADQNFADAQYRLGFMNEKGLGIQQSNQNAVDLYQKAARNGSVEAQRALDRLGGTVSGHPP
jgi:TPR repeat protein